MAKPQQDRQDARTGKLKYNQKFVCNKCGYTGHYTKMSTQRGHKLRSQNSSICQTEHRRKPRIPQGLQKTQQRQYPANALHTAQEADISSAKEPEQVDFLFQKGHAPILSKSSSVQTKL